MRLKVKKVLALASTMVMLSSVVVMAGTHKKQYYIGDYGYAEMKVTDSTGLKSCDVFTGGGGSSSYWYRVVLTTAYSTGENIQSTGIVRGSAYIDTSYDDAEDYSAENSVYTSQNGVYRDRIVLTGY